MVGCSLRRIAVRLFVAVGLALVALPSAAAAAKPATVTPIVLFPAYHLTRLRVDVSNQGVAPGCPRSGSFEYWFQNPRTSVFSQTCQDQLLTLQYAADSPRPMADRFSNQPGVTVTIPDFGRTESAPFYEPMYERLEAAGYVRNRSIRVAGYDARLTPDMDDFLNRTKRLIKDTYNENGHQPVHVVGHSNGPLYIQYLLTHTSRHWREKYIQGFTPIAGNFPGAGVAVLHPVHWLEHHRFQPADRPHSGEDQRAAVSHQSLDVHERRGPRSLRRARGGPQELK